MLLPPCVGNASKGVSLLESEELLLCPGRRLFLVFSEMIAYVLVKSNASCCKSLGLKTTEVSFSLM